MITIVVVPVLAGVIVAVVLAIIAVRANRQQAEAACLKMLEGGKKFTPRDEDIPTFERLVAKNRAYKDGRGSYYKLLGPLDVHDANRG